MSGNEEGVRKRNKQIAVSKADGAESGKCKRSQRGEWCELSISGIVRERGRRKGRVDAGSGIARQLADIDASGIRERGLITVDRRRERRWDRSADQFTN